MNYNILVHPKAATRPDFQSLDETDKNPTTLYLGDNLFYLSQAEHLEFFKKVMPFMGPDTSIILEMPEMRIAALKYIDGNLNTETFGGMFLQKEYRALYDLPYVRDLLTQLNFKILETDIDSCRFCIKAKYNA